MPAAGPSLNMPSADSADLVGDYVTALQEAGLRTGRSTVQAAKTFCNKIDRAGGWHAMTLSEQVDSVAKARAFAARCALMATLAHGERWSPCAAASAARRAPSKSPTRMARASSVCGEGAPVWGGFMRGPSFCVAGVGSP